MMSKILINPSERYSKNSIICEESITKNAQNPYIPTESDKYINIYPPTTNGWKRLNDVSKYRCWWVILGKYNHLSNGGKIAEQQFDFVREEFNFYFVTILSFFTLLQFFLSSLCYNSTLLHRKAVAPVRHKQFQFSSPERRQK